MRTFALALASALAVLSSRESFGQEHPRESSESAAAQPEASAASSEADAAPTEGESRAAALYRDAEANYLAHNVSEALRLMQLSYELSGRPELLFNLGELRRELGQCRPALVNYRQYVSQNQGTHLEKAGQLIEQLQRECPEPVVLSPRKVQAAALPSVALSYWTPARAIGWSALGAALTASVGATYLALKAGADERELEARLEAGAFTEADKQRETSGRRAATWARVLGASAVGLTTVGVTLLVLGPPKKETRTSALSIGCGADTVGASYSGSF